MDRVSGTFIGMGSAEGRLTRTASKNDGRRSNSSRTVERRADQFRAVRQATVLHHERHPHTSKGAATSRDQSRSVGTCSGRCGGPRCFAAKDSHTSRKALRPVDSSREASRNLQGRIESPRRAPVGVERRSEESKAVEGTSSMLTRLNTSTGSSAWIGPGGQHRPEGLCVNTPGDE